MSDVLSWSVAELVAAYAEGSHTPSAVLEQVWEQVDARDGQLGALYAPDRDGSRAAAAEADRRWRARAPRGGLDGVPVTVKENIATAGFPVPLGCAATELVPAAADAPASARLREAGAVIFARTTMPDLGMLTSGLSSFHPRTRNPWAPPLNPGGSSAGAAAAAAAGYGPVHLGTDIGGSVRLPAAWCGLVGLKPSAGRVPVAPAYRGRAIGPLTRTVADTAAAMAVITRPDRRDHLALPPSDLDWAGVVDDPVGALAGLRVAVHRDAGVGLAVDDPIAAAVDAVAAVLADAGATVEELPPFLHRDLLDGLDTFWRVRAWSDLVALAPSRRDAVLPAIREWAATAADVGGVSAFRASNAMDAMAVATLAATEPFDLVLSPTVPVLPPSADWPSPTNDPQRPFEHIAFTVPYNMSGQPAVSVGWTHTDGGLPIGVQLAGRRFDDLGVLRAAAAVEALRGPQLPWPL